VHSTEGAVFTPISIKLAPQRAFSLFFSTRFDCDTIRVAMSLKLIYYDGRGLAEVSRLLLAYGGIDHEDVRVTQARELPDPCHVASRLNVFLYCLKIPGGM
jgi:hypothetical protein